MAMVIDVDSHFEPGDDWLLPYPKLAARLPKLEPAKLAVDTIVVSIAASIIVIMRAARIHRRCCRLGTVVSMLTTARSTAHRVCQSSSYTKLTSIRRHVVQSFSLLER